jgi:hypothetical protein
MNAPEFGTGLSHHHARQRAATLLTGIVDDARTMLTDNDETTVWTQLRANLTKAMDLTSPHHELAADLLTTAILLPAKEQP